MATPSNAFTYTVEMHLFFSPSDQDLFRDIASLTK